MVVTLESISEFIRNGDIPSVLTNYCDTNWYRFGIKLGCSLDIPLAIEVNYIKARSLSPHGLGVAHKSIRPILEALKYRSQREFVPIVAMNTTPKIGKFLKQFGFEQRSPNTWIWWPVTAVHTRIELESEKRLSIFQCISYLLRKAINFFFTRKN